jgi:hypothetical protein
MTLPTTDADRKALPLYDGTFGYFPDALAEVARVSMIGNAQHNPGEPLHWAREKSTDQRNTAFRHTVDHNSGTTHDTDGTWHLAKSIWRQLAELQLAIEAKRKQTESELKRASGWAEGPSGINPGDILTVERAPSKPDPDATAFTISCGSCGRIYNLSAREHAEVRMLGLECTCGHTTELHG